MIFLCFNVLVIGILLDRCFEEKKVWSADLYSLGIHKMMCSIHKALDNCFFPSSENENICTSFIDLIEVSVSFISVLRFIRF